MSSNIQNDEETEVALNEIADTAAIYGENSARTVGRIKTAKQLIEAREERLVRINRLKLAAAKRLLERTRTMESGCIEWTGRTQTSNYGSSGYDDGEFRTEVVHRIAYYLFVGPIAEGMTIDHLCNNRICVNVKHLRQVTREVNSKRGKKPVGWEDKCSKGHDFTPDNTVVRSVKGMDGKPHTYRKCIICRNIETKMTKRKFRARLRAERDLAQLTKNKDTEG